MGTSKKGLVLAVGTSVLAAGWMTWRGVTNAVRDDGADSIAEVDVARGDAVQRELVERGPRIVDLVSSTELSRASVAEAAAVEEAEPETWASRHLATTVDGVYREARRGNQRAVVQGLDRLAIEHDSGECLDALLAMLVDPELVIDDKVPVFVHELEDWFVGRNPEFDRRIGRALHQVLHGPIPVTSDEALECIRLLASGVDPSGRVAVLDLVRADFLGLGAEILRSTAPRFFGSEEEELLFVTLADLDRAGTSHHLNAVAEVQFEMLDEGEPAALRLGQRAEIPLVTLARDPQASESARTAALEVLALVGATPDVALQFRKEELAQDVAFVACLLTREDLSTELAQELVHEFLRLADPPRGDSERAARIARHWSVPQRLDGLAEARAIAAAARNAESTSLR